MRVRFCSSHLAVSNADKADPEVIRIGVNYLRVDGFILPIYMMLFAVNSFLQALKRPIWTFWIGVYRQAFGVAFFSYAFVVWGGFGVLGVWFGIATVISGWLISLIVAEYVARGSIGSLRAMKAMEEPSLTQRLSGWR